jgi:hypothetical protein
MLIVCCFITTSPFGNDLDPTCYDAQDPKNYGNWDDEGKVCHKVLTIDEIKQRCWLGCSGEYLPRPVWEKTKRL